MLKHLKKILQHRYKNERNDNNPKCEKTGGNCTQEDTPTVYSEYSGGVL